MKNFTQCLVLNWNENSPDSGFLTILVPCAFWWHHLLISQDDRHLPTNPRRIMEDENLQCSFFDKFNLMLKRWKAEMTIFLDIWKNLLEIIVTFNYVIFSSILGGPIDINRNCEINEIKILPNKKSQLAGSQNYKRYWL